jgi:hypothetical protein
LRGRDGVVYRWFPRSVVDEFVELDHDSLVLAGCDDMTILHEERGGFRFLRGSGKVD